jgi:hypothetical protein
LTSRLLRAGQVLLNFLLDALLAWQTPSISPNSVAALVWTSGSTSRAVAIPLLCRVVAFNVSDLSAAATP